MALGLAAIGVLLAWQGTAALKALSSTSPFTLLAAVAFYLATQMLSTWKWNLLLRAGLKQSQAPPNIFPTFGESYRIYLIGMFYNLWLPTTVGGDAMRAYMAGKSSGRVSIAATSILVERVTGFLALLVIGGVAFLWSVLNPVNASASPVMQSVKMVFLAAIAVVALFLGFVFLLNLGSRKQDSGAALSTQSSKIKSITAKIATAIRVYSHPGTRKTLLAALLISFVFQGFQVVLNFYLARAVGLPVPFLMMAWLVPVLSIAALMPVSVGGLGVREGAAVALLGGVLSGATSAGTVIAWSLLMQATLWLSGLPGALLLTLQTKKE